MNIDYFLHPDEDISDLTKDYRIIQKKHGFRFSIDAVLLAHFASFEKNAKIIDLGCGSGVLPLLLKSREQNLNIIGVEIQKSYADLSKRNMELNQTDVTICHSDLRQLPKNWGGSFDLVISNPPFFPIGTGKINPNDECAIARHEIYCTLDELLQCAKRLLKPFGRLVMIYKPERLSELLTLCQKYQLTPKRLRFVQPYHDSNANLLLLEAIKIGRNPLEVLPPLIVYQAKNIYTDEILSIYGGADNV